MPSFQQVQKTALPCPCSREDLSTRVVDLISVAMLQHCVGVAFEVKELFSEVFIACLCATAVLGVEDVMLNTTYSLYLETPKYSMHEPVLA